MDSDAPSATRGSAFSNAQPLRNLVVLSIVSFGLYPTYWLYRNLKIVKAHKHLSIRPGWRTFGAFIPVLGWPVFNDQLQLFRETTSADGVATSFSPWQCTLAFQLFSLLMWLVPLPWGLLGSGAVVFLLPVQRALNEYWMIEQPGLPTRQGYGAGEAALIISCGLVWLMIVVALFIGDRIVAAG
jgi:hypothetical protein